MLGTSADKLHVKTAKILYLLGLARPMQDQCSVFISPPGGFNVGLMPLELCLPAVLVWLATRHLQEHQPASVLGI